LCLSGRDAIVLAKSKSKRVTVAERIAFTDRDTDINDRRLHELRPGLSHRSTGTVAAFVVSVVGRSGEAPRE